RRNRLREGGTDLNDRESDTDIFARDLPKQFMEDDTSLNWLRKPHTLTMMIVTALVVIFGAFTIADSQDTESNVKLFVAHFPLSHNLPLSLFLSFLVLFLSFFASFTFPLFVSLFASLLFLLLLSLSFFLSLSL